MELIKRSPYHHKFVELGATFVDRLGFAAPLSFTSGREEHRAAREAVGAFDVYYQVAVEVAVAMRGDFLQRVVVADAERLAVRRALYTSLCNERAE
jgi:aminomethyltransferase